MMIKPTSRRSVALSRKFIAIGVSVSLMFLDVFGYAAPAVPAVSLAPITIQIPESIGKIEESFNGPKGKTIIYIQDAHDSLEAQEHIAGLVDHFVEKYGVQTVYEEGYEGAVPTNEYFGFIRDTALRKKVAYALMDKLRLGGAEYAHVNRKRDFKLIGADSIRYHLENIAWYEQAARYRKLIRNDLKVIQQEIKGLADRSFPKELKTWMGMKGRTARDELGLFDYLSRMRERYLKRETPQEFERRYPNVATLFVAGAATAEEKKAGDKFRTMDPRVLFREIDQMENDFANMYLETENQRKIFQYYKILEILQRLSKIELTSAEYGIAKKSLQSLNTQELANFIAQNTRRVIVLSKRWETNIRKAIQFYEVAFKRDDAVRDRMEEFIRNPYENTAVLVFGGFHQNEIKALLKQKGLSFYVVSPKMTKIDEKHKAYYKKLMSAGYQPVKASDILGRASRYPPIAVDALFEGPAAVRSEIRLISEGLLSPEKKAKTAASVQPMVKSPAVQPDQRSSVDTRSETRSPSVRAEGKPVFSEQSVRRRQRKVDDAFRSCLREYGASWDPHFFIEDDHLQSRWDKVRGVLERYYRKGQDYDLPQSGQDAAIETLLTFFLLEAPIGGVLRNSLLQAYRYLRRRYFESPVHVDRRDTKAQELLRRFAVNFERAGTLNERRRLLKGYMRHRGYLWAENAMYEFEHLPARQTMASTDTRIGPREQLMQTLGGVLGEVARWRGTGIRDHEDLRILNFLIDRLDDADPWVVKAAIWGIGRVARFIDSYLRKKILRKYYSMLEHHPRLVVRGAVARGLHEILDPESFDVVMDRIRKEPSRWVLTNLVETLEYLIHQFDYESVRHDLIYGKANGLINHVLEIATGSGLAQRSYVGLRQAGLKVLGRTRSRDPQVLERVTALILNEPDSTVQQVAVWAAARLHVSSPEGMAHIDSFLETLLQYLERHHRGRPNEYLENYVRRLLAWLVQYSHQPDLKRRVHEKLHPKTGQKTVRTLTAKAIEVIRSNVAGEATGRYWTRELGDYLREAMTQPQPPAATPEPVQANPVILFDIEGIISGADVAPTGQVPSGSEEGARDQTFDRDRGSEADNVFDLVKDFLARGWSVVLVDRFREARDRAAIHDYEVTRPAIRIRDLDESLTQLALNAPVLIPSRDIARGKPQTRLHGVLVPIQSKPIVVFGRGMELWHLKQQLRTPVCGQISAEDFPEVREGNFDRLAAAIEQLSRSEARQIDFGRLPFLEGIDLAHYPHLRENIRRRDLEHVIEDMIGIFASGQLPVSALLSFIDFLEIHATDMPDRVFRHVRNFLKDRLARDRNSAVGAAAKKTLRKITYARPGKTTADHFKPGFWGVKTMAAFSLMQNAMAFLSYPAQLVEQLFFRNGRPLTFEEHLIWCLISLAALVYSVFWLRQLKQIHAIYDVQVAKAQAFHAEFGNVPVDRIDWAAFGDWAHLDTPQERQIKRDKVSLIKKIAFEESWMGRLLRSYSAFLVLLIGYQYFSGAAPELKPVLMVLWTAVFGAVMSLEHFGFKRRQAIALKAASNNAEEELRQIAAERQTLTRTLRSFEATRLISWGAMLGVAAYLVSGAFGHAA
ncbi:MAG: hypothetical protein PHN49_02800, partial [Candidatus Omnitrophica bacterium]|nr:hypothetical protein [Candidatus Omnitrophota bacterium]